MCELETNLSGYLRYVRNGDEIVIEDHDVPVARILPMHTMSHAEREADLVARSILKMPEVEGPMDWDEFFAMPSGSVPHDVAVRAAVEGRGDR